jgi:hypothetical protein
MAVTEELVIEVMYFSTNKIKRIFLDNAEFIGY